MTEWRPVPGTRFEASDEGHIRAVRYVASMPHGGTRAYGGVGGPGAWDGKRYILTCRRDKKTYKVARLVCAAFHGPAPFERAVVMHIDENSRNNRPENLKWGTQKENLNAPGFLAYAAEMAPIKFKKRAA